MTSGSLKYSLNVRIKISLDCKRQNSGMRWGSMTSEILIIEWGGGPRKSGRRSIEIANPYVKETEFMDVTFQKFGLQLCTNPYYNLLAPFSHGAFLAWEFCQLLLPPTESQLTWTRV